MDIYRQHTHNRSIGWSTWHLQWCTKYRYKVFGSQERRNLCKVLLHEAAKRHKIEIFDCEVDADHVHVIASLPLTMTPTDATNKLKGFTSRAIFLHHPQLRLLYKKGHFWSPGKFIGSVGHITLEKAKQYLETHHAKSFTESQPRSGAKGLPEGQAFRPGRMSNDIIEQPTAENICIYAWQQLAGKLAGLEEIKLYETADSYCLYRGK